MTTHTDHHWKIRFDSMIATIISVFGEELDHLDSTQTEILNRLIRELIATRGDDPTPFTREEIQAVREALHEECSMAAFI